MPTPVIRAKHAKEYNADTCTVTLFRNCWRDLYKRQGDGYYTSDKEAVVHYAEGALLGLSDMEVVEFIRK